jgi:hypothetical protein
MNMSNLVEYAQTPMLQTLEFAAWGFGSFAPLREEGKRFVSQSAEGASHVTQKRSHSKISDVAY